MKEEEILGILPLHIRTIIKQAGINWDELQEIRLRIQKPVILKYNAKTCYLSEQGKITTRKEQLHIVTSQEIRQAMEYISSYSMYAYIEQLKQGFLTIRGGHRVGICGTVVMDHDKVKTIRPEIAVVIAVISSILLAMYGLKQMEEILTVFEMIRSYSKIPQSYFQILLKLIGISFICEFASNICKDAGQASIAKQIEFAGKLAILIVGLPVFESLLGTIQKLLGNGT